MHWCFLPNTCSCVHCVAHEPLTVRPRRRSVLTAAASCRTPPISSPWWASPCGRCPGCAAWWRARRWERRELYLAARRCRRRAGGGPDVAGVTARGGGAVEEQEEGMGTRQSQRECHALKQRSSGCVEPFGARPVCPSFQGRRLTVPSRTRAPVISLPHTRARTTGLPILILIPLDQEL